MVVTIEPGAYLANCGIGARIEDNISITANGAEILSAESHELK
jgi:Xaa-Pro aminopeptidase